MIMRVIDKETLVGLASRYAWDQIPREVVDYWIKMYGKNITIESEETDSSHTTRAVDPKSAGDPGSSDEQSTDGAQECEEKTENNNPDEG